MPAEMSSAPLGTVVPTPEGATPVVSVESRDESPASLISQATAELLDQDATKLNGQNDVEGSWFLRGVADALQDAGIDTDAYSDENYGRFYRAGFTGVAKARTKLGV